MKKSLILFIGLLLISVYSYTQILPNSQKVRPYSGPYTDLGPALYSQMTPTGWGGANQYFPDMGGCFIQFVDDFVVPAGPGWTIADIETHGWYYNANPNLGPPIDFIVEIFMDVGGAPAATPLHSILNIPYSVTGTPGNMNLFELNLPSSLFLAPGTYWISILPNMAFSPSGQYACAFDASQVGSEAYVRDPCGFLYPTTFTPYSVFAGPPPVDLCFALYGPSGPPVPVSNWAVFVTVLLIVIFSFIFIRRRIYN